MFQLSPASVHRLVAGCLSLGFFATLPFTMHSQTAASPTAPTATKVAAGSFHDTDTAGYTAEDFRFTTKGNDLYQIQSRLEQIVYTFNSRRKLAAGMPTLFVCCWEVWRNSRGRNGPGAPF